MRIEDQVMERVSQVLDSSEIRFDALVKLSGLDPVCDFVGADLSGVDFRGSDLSDFDLSSADLRRAIWDGKSINTLQKCKNSMRGKAQGAVQVQDFSSVVELSRSLPYWHERFLAFSIAVDYWGLIEPSLKTLKEIVRNDNSVYFRLCASSYFLAEFLGAEEVKAYCKEMAKNKSSRGNWARKSKLRGQYLEMLSVIAKYHPRLRVPEEVQSGEITAFFSSQANRLK